MIPGTACGDNQESLALLGLRGEDKLRPYEFNPDRVNSRRGGPSMQVRLMALCDQ